MSAFRAPPRHRDVEHQLQSARNRLRSLLSATSVASWTTDEAGKIVEGAPGWRAFTGRSLEAGWLEAVHPDDREHIRLVWDRALAAKHPCREECRVRRLDGSYAAVEASGIPVLDDDGVLREWVGTLRFAEARNKTQVPLGETEVRSRAVVAALSEGVVLQDAQGRIQMANASAERLLALSFAQLQGRTSTDPRWQAIHEDGSPFPGEDHPAMVSLRTGRPQSQVMMGVIRPDGSRVWLAVTSQPLFEANGRTPYAVVTSFFDLTERWVGEQEKARLLELEKSARAEAEAASRLKSEFLASVSHELRTPLTSVLSWIQLMQARRLDPSKWDHALDVIARSARTLNQLVSDLLDTSRIDSERLELELQDVDLGQCARQALEAVRVLAQAKGVQLEQRTEHVEVRGDAARLQQVVWNLLSNAVKFTPRGGRVTLLVWAEGPTALVEVSDTGEGIEPRFLPHVFERFTQADSSVTRPHGGLGLGLAITSELVLLHGGRINAESAGPGHGSRFLVQLPARPHVEAATKEDALGRGARHAD
ncbi:MAG: PAS domain-containing sensor histidine kinase [Deltaproteobacteria bacterium]|nr:PAS domain-containing sensor histidine kinase [Deltaproteobacteria bacterium]